MGDVRTRGRRRAVGAKRAGARGVARDVGGHVGMRLAALALLALVTACVPARAVPPAPETDPTEAWGRRLEEVVTAEGEVDYAALRRDSKALADFLGWAAVHGPESDRWRLSDDDLRLAWHLNVVNAWVLWSVVTGDPLTGYVPGAGDPAPRRDALSLLRGPPLPWVAARVPLDGETVWLDRHVTHTLLAPTAEPLAVGALACAARSCPPVPRVLFAKQGLQRALTAQMRRWVESGRLVRGDGATFRFSPALRPWMPLFRRWSGVASPCALAARYASPPLSARLADCPAWTWDRWDARLDGRAP